MRREEVLTALSQHRPLLAEFGVKSLRLFGSVARNEASTASDVDLLVAFDHSPSYSEFMRLKILFEDLLGAKVDLVTEYGLRARVRPSVERDAILVA
ncbi:MAG TPA: nucleotidyltransferase family protein [Thermoanaerobaculia bacterium]|nr:nucleotidyltransferase family protein [Thermoanaerobaculia bacterium]